MKRLLTGALAVTLLTATVGLTARTPTDIPDAKLYLPVTGERQQVLTHGLGELQQHVTAALHDSAHLTPAIKALDAPLKASGSTYFTELQAVKHHLKQAQQYTDPADAQLYTLHITAANRGVNSLLQRVGAQKAPVRKASGAPAA